MSTIKKRGLTNQYIFREYRGLTSNECKPDKLDKKAIEDELEEDDTEESKDTMYTEGAIEIVYQNNGFYYREINRSDEKAGTLSYDGKIEKIQHEMFRDSFDELVTDEVLIKMKDKTEFDNWYNNKTINIKKVVSTSNDVKIGDTYKNAKDYGQHYKIISLY